MSDTYQQYLFKLMVMYEVLYIDFGNKTAHNKIYIAKRHL